MVFGLFRFLSYLGFLDTKLWPTSTMKSEDKSSKHRFGHVNRERHKSQFIFEYHFYRISYVVVEKPLKN